MKHVYTELHCQQAIFSIFILFYISGKYLSLPWLFFSYVTMWLHFFVSAAVRHVARIFKGGEPIFKRAWNASFAVCIGPGGSLSTMSSVPVWALCAIANLRKKVPLDRQKITLARSCKFASKHHLFWEFFKISCKIFLFFSVLCRYKNNYCYSLKHFNFIILYVSHIAIIVLKLLRTPAPRPMLWSSPHRGIFLNMSGTARKTIGGKFFWELRKESMEN